MPEIVRVNTTPPPPPVKEPPKVKMPETEAELEARRANVIAAMWETKPPKPTVAADETATEQTDDEKAKAAEEAEKIKAEAEAKAKADAEAAATAKPAPAAPAVDAQALIAQTAKQIGDEVGRAIESAKPEPPTPAQEAPELELTLEDQRDAEIIAKMEELDPSLKGRAEAFKTFARQRYDYESDWRAKHPGAQFNPDDAEHEEFYKSQPEIDPDTFEAAKIELLVDRKVAQRIKPIQDRDDEDKKQSKTDRAIAQHAPKIVENIKARIVESVAAVNPDVGKMLEGMNPLSLTQEEQDKLNEADPITARFMGPMVRDELVPMLVELEKSVAPGAEYALDPRKNPVHAEIAKFVSKFETAMVAKPEKRDGRTFITISELNDRQREIAHSKATPETKQRKLNELQATYWTASVDDIQKTIVKDISKRAKAIVDDFDGVAQRKYKPDAKKAAAKPAAAPPTPEPGTAPAANGRPRPPAVASQATVVDTSRAGKGGEKSYGETAVEVMWGR